MVQYLDTFTASFTVADGTVSVPEPRSLHLDGVLVWTAEAGPVETAPWTLKAQNPRIEVTPVSAGWLL